MRRLVPVLLLVLLVAFFVFRGVGREDTDPYRLGSETVRVNEQRIAEGDIAAVERALERGDGLSQVAADYLRSALALKAGDFDRALELSRRAGDVAKNDWRPFSVEYAALLALDRKVEAGTLARRAAERMPGDERVLAMAAHDYAASETDPDPVKALELLAAIDALPERKAPPDDPTALLPSQIVQVRFLAATRAGRYDTALAAARELARDQPNDPSAAIVLGEAARRAGQWGEAAAAYRRAIAAVPNAVPWRENLVAILLADPDSLQAALDESEALLSVAPSSREARVLRARALVRSEELRPDGPDEAASIYRGLLADRPDDTEVLRNLAVLLYDWKVGGQAGTYLDEAHALLRRYRRAGGEIDDTLAPIWEILEKRERDRGAADPTAQARAAFEEAPGDARAATALIEALVASGRDDEVGKVVRRVTAAAPNDPAVCVLAARHFATPGPDHDPAIALNYLTHAAPELGGLDALPEPLLWLRCRALLDAGRDEEAFRVAGLLGQLRQGAAPYLAARGTAAFRTGRMAAAEQAYRAALAVDPQPARRIDLARVLVEEPEGAVEAAHELEKVIEEGGRTVEAVRLYGRALLGIEGRRDEGLAVLTQVVLSQPDDLQALGALAAAHHEDGRDDVARRAIERYRTKGGRPVGPAEKVWRDLLGDE